MSNSISLAKLLGAVAATALSLVALVGCGSGSAPAQDDETIASMETPTPVPGSYPSSNGVMVRGNIQGTGVYDTAPLIDIPSESWHFTSTWGHPSSVPAVVSNTVYFGTYNGTLYALDSKTGSMRWRCWLCDEGIRSSAVAGDTIYVPSMDERLYALDSNTGTTRWVFTIHDPSKPFALFSDPVVDRGVVYVGSTRDAFFALDAATGQVKWRIDASGWASAPALANGTIYFGGRTIDGHDNTYIYAVAQATGREIWRVPLKQDDPKGSPSGLQDTPAVANGTVFAATWGDGLLALDAATGRRKWQYGAGSTILNSPAVAYGKVYITDDGKLIALDATTGKEEWRLGDEGFSTTAPFIAGHVVYFTSTGATSLAIPFLTEPEWGGYIYAVDARTGRELWRYKVNALIPYSPTISDGVIYYGDEDGYFHALR